MERLYLSTQITIGKLEELKRRADRAVEKLKEKVDDKLTAIESTMATIPGMHTRGAISKRLTKYYSLDRGELLYLDIDTSEFDKRAQKIRTKLAEYEN